MLMLAIASGLGIFSRAQAAPWFGSANILDEKSWSVGGYYDSSKTKPKVKVGGVSAIQVPVSGGSSTIFSNSNADVEMEQRTASDVAVIKCRPRGGLQYEARLGQVRSFELEFS